MFPQCDKKRWTKPPFTLRDAEGRFSVWVHIPCTVDMLGGQETASSIGRFPLGEWERGGGGGGGGERRVIASLWSYTTHIVHGGPLQLTHFLYKSFPPLKSFLLHK